MDIDNLGSETLGQLIERGVLNDVDDIYRFDTEQLLDWDGFGARKVALIRRASNAAGGSRSGPCCRRSACRKSGPTPPSC